MTRRLAYLGPQGTYSEEAAMLYDEDAELVAATTLPGVVECVHGGEADEGIVPVENSLEGTVTFTADLLIQETALKIKSELVLPIHHCLLAKPGGSEEDVEVIYSHPQSLGQCRGYLQRRFPDASLMPSLSNSSAVGDMLKSERRALAIAGKRAAKFFDARILEEEIEDNRSNATRFIVLAAEDGPPTGKDKTSICFNFDVDRPGSLVSVLQEFSNRGINLNKIESRPTRRSLGRYFFLADVDGHKADDAVRDALDAIGEKVSMLKVLGSYPRYALPQ